MCSPTAGLPPAPEPRRGGRPRAGARVPKRPWRGRGREGPSPEAPAPAENRLRWPPREDWTRAPAAFVRFLSVRSPFLLGFPDWPPPKGPRLGFSRVALWGQRGRSTQSVLGGGGSPQAPLFLCPRTRPPSAHPGLALPLQRRELCRVKIALLKINMLSVCHLVRSVWGKESLSFD